jgi:hypothetical protein
MVLLTQCKVTSSQQPTEERPVLEDVPGAELSVVVLLDLKSRWEPHERGIVAARV